MTKKEKHLQLWEHLEELRWTIFKLIGALLVTTVIAFVFIDDILLILMLPIENVASENPEFVIRKIMTTPFDGIMIKMKTAFLGGIVIGFPFVLYFIWSFISAGLKKNESKAFIWICGVGTFSFTIGVVCGYLLITPVLKILLNMGMQSVDNLWTVKEFVNFVFYWLLIAGLIFELPMAMVILTRLGVIEVNILKNLMI